MQWAIAEWDYVATHEDELTFRKGDHILIQDNAHHEWWEGECNGLSGVFPANRCRLLEGEYDPGAAATRGMHEGEHGHHHDHKLRQQQHGQQHHGAEARLSQEAGDARDHGFQGTSAHLPQQFSHEHPMAPGNPPPPSDVSQAHASASIVQSPPPEPTDGLSDEDEVVLPPNWSVTTNSKGRLYYYNVLTQETSWKLPSSAMATSAAPLQPSTAHPQPNGHPTEHSDHLDMVAHDSHMHEATQDLEYGVEVEDPLPEGWSSAQDEDGSFYFFNESTGETTWDRPTSPEIQRAPLQYSISPQSTLNDLGSSPSSSTSNRDKSLSSPSATMAAPQRQLSADETMLQSQMLGLGLSDEELHALELNQLPPEHIQRKGSLRVKSQKVSSNATISSWKDYWVVIYKGFLLFYRDEGGLIKNALSMKSSADSLNKIKHVTQVKPSGCFDAEKVAVELPVNGLAMTKKKNFFYITPGSSVRLLLQDASGGDEKAWFKDIQTSLASRKADELSGSDEPYLVQLLKRQTAGGGEVSGLKMNKKIEEKDSKTHKGPLKTDKARGIRSMVAHGIHVPRRKSAQDERLKLPAEDDSSHSHTGNVDTTHHSESFQRPSTSRPTFTVSTRKSSRDQSRDLSSSFKRDQDGSIGTLTERHEDVSGSPGSGSHHGAKAKLSNMSRNFFSKDKDKDKEKDREKEKEKEKDKEKEKEKGKYKIKDKYKHKDLKKQGLVKSSSDGSQVFGGSLVVETGRTVPRVVELCINAIEARGLSIAGIYRVSGHMGSIQNIKRAFNEGSDHLDRMIEKEPDINTIAALLKLYFRELREPLMLFEFYPSFIAAADIEDYNEKLYTIKSLVHSLPEPNFSTLQYLMMHLGRVQDQYHTTKMDSANLAICFAPNLLRQQVDDLTSIINTGKQSSIIDTLIEQREWIFDPYPEEDEEEQEDEEEEEEVEVGNERAEENMEEGNWSRGHEHTLNEHHDDQQQQHYEGIPAHTSSSAPYEEECRDTTDEATQILEPSTQPPPFPPRTAPDHAQGALSDDGTHTLLDHQPASSQRAHHPHHPSYPPHPSYPS
ncbi:hypothetical protein EC968_006429 [Mortierella alpina]|nr:hypothetical protein EC968_006429 [Mortierella alpina]